MREPQSYIINFPETKFPLNIIDKNWFAWVTESTEPIFSYKTNILAYQYKGSCYLEPDKTFNKRKVTIGLYLVWLKTKQNKTKQNKTNKQVPFNFYLYLSFCIFQVYWSILLILLWLSSLIWEFQLQSFFSLSICSAGCCYYIVFLMNLITLLHLFSR